MAKSGSGSGKAASGSKGYSVSGGSKYTAAVKGYNQNSAKGEGQYNIPPTAVYDGTPKKGYGILNSPKCGSLSEKARSYFKGQKGRLRDDANSGLDKLLEGLRYDLAGPLSKLINKGKNFASGSNKYGGLLARLQMVEYKMKCPRCTGETINGICPGCLGNSGYK